MLNNRFFVFLTLIVLLPSTATVVLGQTKKVVLSAPPVSPAPHWQAASQANVGYGIKMDTFERSDSAPWIRIYGSKGKWTNRAFLDNGKANYKGGEDYFFLSGTDVGNVGIPLRVEFAPGGDDAHGFTLVSVDYFANANLDMSEVKSSVKDFNNRAKVLEKEFDGAAGFGVFSGRGMLKESLVVQVEFGESLHLAVNTRRHTDNLEYGPGPFYLNASQLLGDSDGKELEVNVSKLIVAVDARSANFPIRYNSREDSTVSQEEIRRAINSEMAQTSSSNSTTVGVKVEKEGSAPLVGKVKAELSFAHTHTTGSSRSNSSSSENQSGRNGSHTSSTGIEFQVNMGDVTFFEVTKTATVTLLGGIPELTTISPQVHIETNIRPVTFRTNLDTGELCRLSILSKTSGSFTEGKREYIFQLGTELKDDPTFLSIAERAWGKGENGFSSRTEITDEVRAKFGKSGK